MANILLNNTYFLQDSAASALAWPAHARIQSIVVYAVNTLAALTFLVSAGTPVFEFRLITQGQVSVGSATSVVESTYTYPLGGVDFPTAWIPTTLTACSAWVHFV